MAASSRSHPALAFFHFHLRVGIRIALRTLASATAVIFALYYLFRLEFFVLLVLAFLIDSGNLISALIISGISLSAAGMAARRICLGLTGWIRHLPLDNRTNRRLAGLAVFTVQIPVLVFLAVPLIILSNNLGISPDVHLLGLPFLGLASALCVIPVQRQLLIRPLAFSACLLSASGKWPLLAAGIFLIAACDFLSGSLVPIRKPPRFRWSRKGYFLAASISWRALRFRVLASYIIPLITIGAGLLFVANNAVNTRLASRAALFSSALSLAFLTAGLASMLASRRPSWPWSRSLPWSAGQRIVMDFLFLGVHAVPLLILSGAVDMNSTIPLLLCLPLLLLIASQAIRRASEYRMGTFGQVLMWGMPGAFLLTLIPWTSLFFLVITPLALKSAIEEEKRQKVSLWLELHHLAAGDSLSWSQQ